MAAQRPRIPLFLGENFGGFMAQDYRGFQDKIGADMASASASAAGMEKIKGTKLRIRQSDLESLIPAGSTVEYQPIPCHRLKFGDIIFVRSGKEFVLRRYVGFQVGKNGAVAAVARANPARLETYPDTAVVGKVTGVDSQGRHFDPHKKESQMQRWANEWTCFGTSTPLKRLAHNLKMFSRMMSKKK